MVLDEACLRKDHLWSRMDHLLSAGYLVENQVSTSSFSTTHLLTFANHQPEQVRIHSHDGLNTFVSGRRRTVVHHNSEVILNNYLFALQLACLRYSCKYCDYKTDKKSNHDSHTKFVHFKV